MMPTRYAFFLLPLAAAIVGISTHFWLHDDAFISFRYARNFAAGLGLVYNPGAASPIE